MQPVFVAVGALLGVGAAFVFRQRMKAQEELNFMARMNASVNEVSHGVMAELIGKVSPVSTALKGPKSGKDCVYYRFKVERYQAHQSKNGTTYTWDTISQDVQGVPFYLDDGTGKVMMDVSGDSGVDALKTFEGVENDPAPKMSMFGITLSGGATPMRYTEFSIPVGQPLYVLGLIQEDEKGKAHLVRPKDERPFVVSVRSEDALKGERRGRIFQYAVASGLLAAASLALVYFGLISP